MPNDKRASVNSSPVSRRSFLRALAAGAALAMLPFVRERPPEEPPPPKGYTWEQYMKHGFVYAPYIPLYTTRDLSLSPEAMKRFATRMSVNKHFYRRITFS